MCCSLSGLFSSRQSLFGVRWLATLECGSLLPLCMEGQLAAPSILAAASRLAEKRRQAAALQKGKRNAPASLFHTQDRFNRSKEIGTSASALHVRHTPARYA